MKRIVAGLLALVCGVALGQVYPNFQAGQVLTAQQLNAAFALTAASANGTLTNPAITGGTITGVTIVGLQLSSLATQAANTVVANVTGSSASPTAVSVPSCSTSSSALSYTSGSGFGCNAAVNAAQLGGATFAAPGSIGSSTPGTGAFTTLSASSTVSGAGFSTYLASPPSIGTTAPAAGAFTTLSASGTVSGTGFSTYLASPPAIGGTAAAAGSFTTIAASSTITPSQTSGIVGTTTNNNANTGSVGEYLSATSSAISMTNGSYVDIATESLTAGDWDVSCDLLFTIAATTTVTAIVGGINTTANTNPNGTVGTGFTWSTSSGTLSTGAGTIIFPTPVVRESLSATTTVRCGAQANFATSTLTATGFIRARRVR